MKKTLLWLKVFINDRRILTYISFHWGLVQQINVIINDANIKIKTDPDVDILKS